MNKSYILAFLCIKIAISTARQVIFSRFLFLLKVKCAVQYVHLAFLSKEVELSTCTERYTARLSICTEFWLNVTIKIVNLKLQIYDENILDRNSTLTLTVMWLEQGFPGGIIFILSSLMAEYYWKPDSSIIISIIFFHSTKNSFYSTTRYLRCAFSIVSIA